MAKSYRVIIAWVNGDTSTFNVRAKNKDDAENQVILSLSGTARDHILSYWSLLIKRKEKTNAKDHI